jgi:alcohol dehydrogenase
MEFNLPAAKKRYAEIARLAEIEEDDEGEAASQLIQMIKFLSASLNIPHFKELGVEESKLNEIARKSFENNSNSSNPREASAEDYLAILRRISKES